MTSSILSIGTAVPKHKIPQTQVVEFMARAHGMKGAEQGRLRALYRASGIENRYSTIPDYALNQLEGRSFYPPSEGLDPFPTTKARSDYYRKEAIELSVDSANDCLSQTTVKAEDITHLVTISCTGMYAPGLDIDLVNRLGLSKSVQRTCINFMGCYAAFVGIKAANAFCTADPKAKVLVVATELCTLHFQNKTDDDNLISNAIFGDGSAALLIAGEDTGRNGLKLKPLTFHNEIFSAGAQEMAWNIGDFGFEMKLSAYVPVLIEKGIKKLVQQLKDKVAIDTIHHYALHPGGKRILEVIEQELGLDKNQDWAGRQVLKDYGNMSSPTVVFVLKKLYESLNTGHKGNKILSLAFGPGLTVESMILEVI